jgi:hypothetical protein
MSKTISDYQKAYGAIPANRNKIHLRQKVYRELKAGRLIRPDTCPVCGIEPEIKGGRVFLYFVHTSLINALEGSWYCLSCFRNRKES